MTNKIVNPLYETLAQREFNIGEILSVIQRNNQQYWTWRVEELVNYYNKALLMNVNGHHHQGVLVITLAWDDTYSFHLINCDGKIKESFHKVYFYELQTSINKRI